MIGRIKQISALLLVLVLVLSLLTVAASAADGAYDIWVGGVQVTDRNRSDVLGMKDKGVGVKYDPATNTLTLTDAAIVGSSNADRANAGIYASGDLTVRLIGTSTVDAPKTTDGTRSAAILAVGTLAFKGTGALHVTAATASRSVGIAAGSLSVSGGDFTMISDDADEASYGIEVGDAVLSGGAIYAVSGDAKESIGISASGTLTVSGGTIRTAAGVGTTVERGISAQNLAVTGGTVIVGAGDVSVYTTESLTLGSGITMVGEKGGYKAGETKVLYQRTADSMLTLSDDRADEGYGVYIGGIPVTPKNCTDVLATGADLPPVTVKPAIGKEGDADYVPATVTLNAAFVYGLPSIGIASIGITAVYDVRIVLNGESTFIAAEIPDGASMLSAAVYGAPGDVEIAGNGSLTLLSQDSDTASYGIYAPTLTVEGGEIRALAGDGAQQSMGIVAGTVEINGGNVTAVAGSSDGISVGVYGTESVTVNGGLVSAAGDDIAIYGADLEIHDDADVMGANEDHADKNVTSLTQKDADVPVTVVVYKGTLSIAVKDQIKAKNGKWSSELTDVTVSGLVDGDRMEAVVLKADGHRLYVESVTVRSTDGTDVTVFYRTDTTDGKLHTRGKAIPIGNGTHQYLCTGCGIFIGREACTAEDGVSCEEAGNCTVCGGAFGEAGAHVWDDGEVIKEPTVDATGEKQFTCTRCGKTRIEILPKLTEDTTTHPESDTTDDPGSGTTTDPVGDTTDAPGNDTTADPGEETTEETTADGFDGAVTEEETTEEPADVGVSDGSDDEGSLWWLWLLLLLILLSKVIAYIIWKKHEKDQKRAEENENTDGSDDEV